MPQTNETIREETERKIDELVRDITAAGWMAKSEAKRRILEIVESELESRTKEVIESIPDGFMIAKGATARDYKYTSGKELKSQLKTKYGIK